VHRVIGTDGEPYSGEQERRLCEGSAILGVGIPRPAGGTTKQRIHGEQEVADGKRIGHRC
jgi:hypothetical protein